MIEITVAIWCQKSLVHTELAMGTSPVLTSTLGFIEQINQGSIQWLNEIHKRDGISEMCTSTNLQEDYNLVDDGCQPLVSACVCFCALIILFDRRPYFILVRNTNYQTLNHKLDDR